MRSSTSANVLKVMFVCFLFVRVKKMKSAMENITPSSERLNHLDLNCMEITQSNEQW